MEAKEGIAFVAQEAKADLLPLHISGTRQLYSLRWLVPKLVKITVVIGKPFSSAVEAETPKDARRALGETIMEKIFVLDTPNMVSRDK